MCQDYNTTIFIFAVFVVSLSSTHTVKFSVFYINGGYKRTSLKFTSTSYSAIKTIQPKSQIIVIR